MAAKVKEKKPFHYEGCVMIYDRVVAHYFKADTWAVSKEKARNNIAYQFRKVGNVANHIPVKLPGNLTLVED